MTRAAVVRRRSTYGIVAAMLCTSLLDLFQTAYFYVGGEDPNLFNWTNWWFAAFEIIVLTGMIGMVRYASSDRARWVAIAGTAVASASLLSGEMFDLLVSSFPNTLVPIQIVTSATLATFSIAIVSFWLEGTLDGKDGMPNIIKVGLFLLPGFLLVSFVLGPLGIDSRIILAALLVVSVAAAVVVFRQIRERDEPAGIDTELGVELVWLSLIWRMGLMVLIAMSALFWRPEIYSAAGMSSAFGILAIPAAFGASRMTEQIVREAKPRFARASWLWWLAAALWMAQVGWLYLIGPSLGADRRRRDVSGV